MDQECHCSPGCTLLRTSPHYPPRPGNWTDDTASPAEQEELKKAHANGAKIEGKGRDTIDCGYIWAVVEHPRWDFRNNRYRLAPT